MHLTAVLVMLCPIPTQNWGSGECNMDMTHQQSYNIVGKQTICTCSAYFCFYQGDFEKAIEDLKSSTSELDVGIHILFWEKEQMLTEPM